MPQEEPIDVPTLVKVKLQELLDSAKAAFADRHISWAEGWQLFLEAKADAVYIVSQLNAEGVDKKAMVMKFAKEFYDGYIAPIDLPYIPNLVEPLVDKALWNIFEAIVSGSVESDYKLLKSDRRIFKRLTGSTGSAPSE